MAQRKDKLWKQVQESPDKFRNIGTHVGEYGDDMLRIDGRLLIPKTFMWNNAPFWRTLINFTHSERVHVGARATLKGFWGISGTTRTRMSKNLSKNVMNAKGLNTAPRYCTVHTALCQFG